MIHLRVLKVLKVHLFPRGERVDMGKGGQGVDRERVDTRCYTLTTAL
jgi:hypothetical protein